jgi:hypothetical protein
LFVIEYVDELDIGVQDHQQAARLLSPMEGQLQRLYRSRVILRQ